MLLIVSGVGPASVSVTVRVELDVPTVWLPKDRADGLKARAVPVAVIGTDNTGLIGSELVTTTDALRIPLRVGVTVTSSVQLVRAGSSTPHPFATSAKSEMLPRPIEMPLMINGASPLLERMRDCAALVVAMTWIPNINGTGRMLATGAIPLPLSATLCGLPGALSVTETMADLKPRASGLNAIEIAQLNPAATVRRQVVVLVKSVAFAPVITMLPIDVGAKPVLASVMVSPVLDVLTT